MERGDAQIIPPPVPPTRTSPPPIDGGRRGGLGSGRGCRLRGRGARPGLRVETLVCWDIVKREEREGFESCNKAKEWKGG